ncbi:TlpA family protein disulfide reductase, partial [Cellulomonas iranensis]|uniref:TlpA family protein disulfide reductase n=1 Tax=Cellulomonas iranensis TaxID=76862 RepID=UPI000AEC193C
MTEPLTLTAHDLGGPRGERATLLQVSTAFCAPCRATRRVLARVAGSVPGVRHVEVDVADAPGLAAALRVVSTPTVVVLDADGRVVTRAEGVPTPAQVLGALAAALPPAVSGDAAAVGGGASDPAGGHPAGGVAAPGVG